MLFPNDVSVYLENVVDSIFNFGNLKWFTYLLYACLENKNTVGKCCC